MAGDVGRGVVILKGFKILNPYFLVMPLCIFLLTCYIVGCVREELDLKPPDPPENLEGEVVEGIVVLNWDHNDEKDLGGYRVFRGRKPISAGEYERYWKTGMDTEFRDEDLGDVGWLYYRVTALDWRGNESDYSNEVEIFIAPVIEDSEETEDKTPPAAPMNLRGIADDEDKEVWLVWDKVEDDDLKGYIVYRSDPKIDEEGYKAVSGVLTEIKFKDKTVEYEKWYFYRVRGIDEGGNESEFSNLAEVWVGLPTGLELE